MEGVLLWLGYGLCHQLPERSFFGGGLQVPVCARDTGIYVGFAIALVLLVLMYGSRRPSELPPWKVGVLLGVFVFAMAVDGVTSYAGLRSTTNELRLATGLLTGFALAAVTVPLIHSQAWRRFDMDRILGEPRFVGWFIGAVPLTYLVVLHLGPRFGVAYPILVGAGIVVTFAAVNLVIVCLLPWFERKADRWLDLKGAASAALALTVLELGAASALKAWLERIAGIVG